MKKQIIYDILEKLQSKKEESIELAAAVKVLPGVKGYHVGSATAYEIAIKWVLNYAGMIDARPDHEKGVNIK